MPLATVIFFCRTSRHFGSQSHSYIISSLTGARNCYSGVNSSMGGLVSIYM